VRKGNEVTSDSPAYPALQGPMGRPAQQAKKVLQVYQVRQARSGPLVCRALSGRKEKRVTAAIKVRRARSDYLGSKVRKVKKVHKVKKAKLDRLGPRAIKVYPASRGCRANAALRVIGVNVAPRVGPGS